MAQIQSLILPSPNKMVRLQDGLAVKNTSHTGTSKKERKRRESSLEKNKLHSPLLTLMRLVELSLEPPILSFTSGKEIHAKKFWDSTREVSSELLFIPRVCSIPEEKMAESASSMDPL